MTYAVYLHPTSIYMYRAAYVHVYSQFTTAMTDRNQAAPTQTNLLTTKTERFRKHPFRETNLFPPSFTISITSQYPRSSPTFYMHSILLLLLQCRHSRLQRLLPAQHGLVALVKLVENKILRPEGRHSSTYKEGRQARHKTRTTSLGRCRCCRWLGIRRHLPRNSHLFR